eukprot:gb/GECH01007728.1/.p1 GENE.gb/GECH01007728.1/~~gb/GECH01007728.1/.p1  ORF type:complete len:101 (+),score=16.85 gb/GECH01007728.1/:1-303(+)
MDYYPDSNMMYDGNMLNGMPYPGFVYYTPQHMAYQPYQQQPYYYTTEPYTGVSQQGHYSAYPDESTSNFNYHHHHHQYRIQYDMLRLLMLLHRRCYRYIR